MRRFCRAGVIIFALLCTSVACWSERPKYKSPCATVNLPGDSTDKPNLCSFLIDSYEQIDDRCGFSFGGSWYNPTNWFRTYHPWDVIPKGVLQDIPLNAADIKNSNWTKIKLPSLARLMTYGFLSDTPAESYSADVEDVSKSLVPLSFNPMLAPEVMLDLGNSRSIQNLTCANALKASENGKVNFSVVTAAEKFSSVENSTSSAKLVYGTFESPIAYERRLHPNTFYFETLAWFETYRRKGGKMPPPPVRFIESVEGVILYDTVKGSMSTDFSGDASASYSVPLGNIQAQAEGQKSVADTTSANLFYALIRGKVAVSTLPAVTDLNDWFSGAHGSLVNLDNPLSKPATWNSSDNTVEASFVVEGMPFDLCKAELWKIKDPKPTSLTLFGPTYHSATTIASGTTKSSGQSPRSACVWTVHLGSAIPTTEISGPSSFLTPNYLLSCHLV